MDKFCRKFPPLLSIFVDLYEVITILTIPIIYLKNAKAFVHHSKENPYFIFLGAFVMNYPPPYQYFLISMKFLIILTISVIYGENTKL